MVMGPEQLGRLVEAHGAALVLYARTWCATAEDIVQEAFVKLASQQRTPDNPVAWLFRVVRNGAVSAARSARRRQRHESAAAARAATWFVPGETGDLDADAVTAALAALAAEDREIVVAHVWGGRTFAEIADLTGLSASTAHRHYLAALESLRERLHAPCATNKQDRPS